ncbi:hypothetical protein M899_0968 [Bacteriovorax sp. BSW11_IV]|uniref:hypothetical protein n=1 Tax=Bacteriovorax sp. BSW11_IV TaxID=1353529 RepID=UPI000389E7FB|nr:hypothetical protein [Bacteriovorax sp. BSW11_IV]EQC48651.1 hypothetical protein M899_0968 [Bacteriovorax sp. BSW11_IV]
MKHLILRTALAFSFMTPAFALTGSYELISGNGEDCARILEITDEGKSITIDLSNDLSSYFNLDSSTEELLIQNINGGKLEQRSTNSSHGTKSKTTTVATRDDNSVNLKTTTKFGTLITTGKAENELTLTLDGDELTLDVMRSYSETFGSGWERQSSCVYKKN